MGVTPITGQGFFDLINRIVRTRKTKKDETPFSHYDDVLPKTNSIDVIEGVNKPSHISKRSISSSEIKFSRDDTIPILYGRKKIPTKAIPIKATNDKLYVIYIISEGEIDSVEKYYLEGVDTSTNNDFNGLYTFNFHSGTLGQSVDSTFASAISGWSETLSGTAYIAAIFNSNKKFTGIPQLEVLAKGRKVYNPITSTTAYSNNVILCLYDFMTSTRYGECISSSQIDSTLLNQAITDASATISGEKAFALNYYIANPSPTSQIVSFMLNHCRGDRIFSEGVWKIRIHKATSSVATFTDDLIWDVKLARPPQKDYFNRIKATYTHQDDWREDQYSLETDGLITGKEILSELNMDLSGCDTLGQVHRLCVYQLNKRLSDLSLSFKTYNTFGVERLDVITVSYSPYGISNKLFYVTKVTNYTIECAEHNTGFFSTTLVNYPSLIDTDLPLPSTAPDPPTNIVLTEVTEQALDGHWTSNIKVTWTKSNFPWVERYDIYFCETGQSYEFFNSVTGNENSILIPTQKQGISYDVKVVAVSKQQVESTEATKTLSIVGNDTPGMILPKDTNLAGYWSFDSIVSGKTQDGSVNSNDAIIVGNLVKESGISGNCLTFSGDGSYLKVLTDDAINFGTGDFSVSFWFKTSQNSVNYEKLLRKINGTVAGWEIGLSHSHPFLYFATDSVHMTKTFYNYSYADGNWHLMVVNFDRSSNATVYVDKVNIGTMDISNRTGSVNTTTSFLMGDTAVDYTGSLDEVRLYNSLLTIEEIKALYYFPGGNTNNLEINNSLVPFNESFEDDLNTIKTNWKNYDGEGENYKVTGGTVGGWVYKVGNNSGNDQRWMIYNRSIPFDPAKLYRFRCRIRQTAGTGTCYIGVAGRNSADDAFVNINGDNNHGHQHYIIASGVSPGSSFVEYTAYLKGVSSTGSDTSHASASNPAVLHEDAKYFRPLILVNYQGSAGTYEIDSFSFDIIAEDADQIPESPTKKWASESGADKTFTHTAGRGVNVCNARYSTFEENYSPPFSYDSSHVVVGVDSSSSFFGGKSLKITATATDGYVYLGSTSNNYNFKISPNKKWLVSFYVKCDTASQSCQIYLRTNKSGNFYGHTFTTAGTANTWERKYCIFDLSADDSSLAMLRVDNDSGSHVMWFDGFMVEEQVGGLTTPSAYTTPAMKWVDEFGATIGARSGTNLKDSSGNILDDSHVITAKGGFNAYQGVPFPFDESTLTIRITTDGTARWFKVASSKLDYNYSSFSFAGLVTWGSSGRFRNQSRIHISFEVVDISVSDYIYKKEFTYSGSSDITDILKAYYDDTTKEVAVYAYLQPWTGIQLFGTWTNHFTRTNSWVKTYQYSTDAVSAPSLTLVTPSHNYEVGADITGDHKSANTTKVNDSYTDSGHHHYINGSQIIYSVLDCYYQGAIRFWADNGSTNLGYIRYNTTYGLYMYSTGSYNLTLTTSGGKLVLSGNPVQVDTTMRTVSVYPKDTSGTYHLGTSDCRWTYIYGKNLNVQNGDIYLANSTNKFKIYLRDYGSSNTLVAYEGYITAY